MNYLSAGGGGAVCGGGAAEFRNAAGCEFRRGSVVRESCIEPRHRAVSEVNGSIAGAICIRHEGLDTG